MAPVHDAPSAPGAERAHLVLVRHGETAWSRTGQHTGVTDLPLTPMGERQARAVGRVLHSQHFGLVLTSPRERARQTASLTGYLDAATVDENLAEWDYGAYEGLTSEQIAAQTGQPWNIWRDGVPQGATPGEQPEDVQRRAEAVLKRGSLALDRGDNVLLFSHAHLLRVLAASWLGLAAEAGSMFALDTATISTLGFEHGRRVLTSWNCAVNHA
ncbi:MAG: histidine phosphatase family protein [Lacisediminihabitans sp.]